MIKKAMILAAGRGKRLQPLTNITPKALVELNGLPLIVHHIQNLKRCGINEIVINLSHLGYKIEQYLGNGQSFGIKISYSHEQDGGLETGGGIVNALPLLGDEPFLTVNADIYCPFAFNELPNLKNVLAHVVLVENPSHNPNGDYAIDGLLLSTRKDPKQYTFSGIAFYQAQFFENCQINKYSVTPLIKKMAERNLVSAQLTKTIWHDIGTEERLQQAKQSIISSSRGHY